jgi:hypothetical protein
MRALQPTVGVLLASLCIAACGDRGWPDPGHGKPPPKPHKDAGVSDARVTDAVSEVIDARSDAASFPECLPPCLRDIWKTLDACLPVLDACTTDHQPPDAGFPNPSSDTICAPEAGWRYESRVDFHSITETVVRNGVTCYHKVTGWGSGVPPASYWLDATGERLAYALRLGSDSNVTVTCGPGVPSSGTPSYVWPSSCVIPTDRCRSKTPGRCPANGDL